MVFSMQTTVTMALWGPEAPLAGGKQRPMFLLWNLNQICRGWRWGPWKDIGSSAGARLWSLEFWKPRKELRTAWLFGGYGNVCWPLDLWNVPATMSTTVTSLLMVINNCYFPEHSLLVNSSVDDVAMTWQLPCWNQSSCVIAAWSPPRIGFTDVPFWKRWELWRARGFASPLGYIYVVNNY